MTTPYTLLLVCLAAIVAIIALTHRRDMRAAHERLRGRSRLVRSPWGNIEYAEGGAGAKVLIVHAAAGGWDQGELIAEDLLDERFHWIAPSRFGYLRSECPQTASVEDQAHAYAFLLDHLHIDRVAVVAMSAGGPSALLFALLHPERVSSLTLISCGVASTTSEEQAKADRKGRMLVRIFSSDFALWMMTRFFRGSLLRLIGDGVESMWVDRVLEAMHPASLRTAGVAFDNRAELPGKRITAIDAPAVIIHAKDDTLQPYHNALFATQYIPHARLLSFEKGGHLVIATERAAIRAAVENHILSHAMKRAA